MSGRGRRRRRRRNGVGTREEEEERCRDEGGGGFWNGLVPLRRIFKRWQELWKRRVI